MDDEQIKAFINHDFRKDNIYLFLRESNEDKYEYMGLLAYVEHDNQREKPVYFKWQILDWNNNESKLFDQPENNSDFNLILKEDSTEYIIDTPEVRKGKNTNEFSNRVHDFEGEAKKNTKLGNLGEDLVVDYEKRYLSEKGKEELAIKVTTTRNIAGNAERYDVLSYDENGDEKYIEVKTTKGPMENDFYISENEVQFSIDNEDKYYLYRLYNLNPKTKTADLVIHKGRIDRSKLKPTNYICKISSKNRSKSI